MTVWAISHFLHQDRSSSLFADIKNPLNQVIKESLTEDLRELESFQYLVKFAWGWTLYPLCLLLVVSTLKVEVNFMLNSAFLRLNILIKSLWEFW